MNRMKRQYIEDRVSSLEKRVSKLEVVDIPVRDHLAERLIMSRYLVNDSIRRAIRILQPFAGTRPYVDLAIGELKSHNLDDDELRERIAGVMAQVMGLSGMDIELAGLEICACGHHESRHRGSLIHSGCSVEECGCTKFRSEAVWPIYQELASIFGVEE